MHRAREQKIRGVSNQRSANRTNGTRLRRPDVEVIDGIRLTVNGRELAVRISERIRWHRERGDSIIVQMKKLAEVERDAAEDLVTLLGRSRSPRAVLEKRLREHQDRAAFLAFLRDHIAEDAVFRLGSDDLKMIDVLPQ